jgi:uncharacterized protein
MRMNAKPALPEFQRYQFEFARHIRDPATHKRPAGVPARRMKVYTQLLYNNLESFLLACFPVLREVLGKRKWDKLVRAFFAGHRCHTPYFRQIPEEFLQYLQSRPEILADYPPFTLSLAHYEWVELDLSVSQREPEWARIDSKGDLLKGRPVLNPVLASLRYEWPVHRIGSKSRPTEREETFLLVYRAEDHDVRFLAINAATARLVALVETGKKTGRQALRAIAREMRHPDPEAVVAHGAAQLETLREQGALLGTLKTTNTL